MTLKLTIAAAALLVGLTTAAPAMPVNNLAGLKTDGLEVEQVRLVCNRWGRCWHVPGRAYGYYAWAPRRHYHRYYRRWW
jgi:hypothetical protein